MTRFALLGSARSRDRPRTPALGAARRGRLRTRQRHDAADVVARRGRRLLREPLLRAHPLLSDGIVDLTAASAFGRSLAFGSAEMQRWFERPALVRVGVAGFADVARASRQAADGQSPTQFDLGVGLRFKIPGTPGVLRADVAHGLHDGANALTFGWLF